VEAVAVAGAWGIAVAAATLTFIKVYEREGSFRKALTYALVLLKIFATVYWLSGLDRPLLKVYYITGGKVVWSGAITANITIILALAMTTVLINTATINRLLTLTRR